VLLELALGDGDGLGDADHRGSIPCHPIASGARPRRR
jgi:hypothetical protein